MAGENGWSQYQNLVLHRLESMEERLVHVAGRLRKIEGRFWVLDTKAGMMGGIAGFIAAAVPMLLAYLSSG